MKTNQKEWLFNIIGVVTAGFLFPVYWMIATAFKSDAELFKTPPLLWPETFRTAGFEAVFTSGVAGYFLNSLLISGAAAVIVLNWPFLPPTAWRAFGSRAKKCSFYCFSSRKCCLPPLF